MQNKNIPALSLIFDDVGESKCVTFVGEYAGDSLLSYVWSRLFGEGKESWDSVPLGTHVMTGTVDQCLGMGSKEVHLALSKEEVDTLFYGNSNGDYTQVRPDLKDIRVVEIIDPDGGYWWHVVGGKPWSRVEGIEEWYSEITSDYGVALDITVTTLGNIKKVMLPDTTRLGNSCREAAQIFQVDTLYTTPQPPSTMVGYDEWLLDIYSKLV